MICKGDNCRITLPPSPKYIKEHYLDSLSQPYDVFALTVGKLTFPSQPSIITNLVDICWRHFRNRPIGDYDYAVWVENLDDKVNEIWYTHRRTISLMLTSAIPSLITGKDTVSESVVNGRDALTTNDLTTTNNLSETEDIVTTTGGTVGVVDASDDTGTNTVEVEDNPDTAAGATKYLSNKTVTTPALHKAGSSTETTDMDVTVDGSRANTGTVKNTGTVAASDDSTTERDVTTSREDGLEAERILAVYEAVREGLDKFANDLEPLFMNRW